MYCTRLFVSLQANYGHKFLNIKIMKAEENKKKVELNDEQFDNVAGGMWVQSENNYTPKK